MTDKEFDELLTKLYRLSSMDGDLGNEYWTRVIKELKLMRQQAQASRK